MIGFKLATIAVLALVSVSLAVVEAAFYLIKRRRLGHFAESNPRATLVNAYLDDPSSLLMPAHIGTYTAHVGMTVMLTWTFLDYHPRGAILAAFLLMMLYLVLLRLMLPYAVVRRNPERSLLVLTPFFAPYARALGPLVAWLRKRAVLTHEEVREDSGEKVRTIPAVPPPPVHDPDEVRVVDSLTRFSKTLVREVMTPRPDIESIGSDASIAELRELMRESKYSRIPVYREKLDEIMGVVTVRDVVEYEGDENQPVESISRSVFLVPETKKIAELLKELQAEHVTFAVVLDEYGGTAGVVSVEDIVEELVGEIKDEYDVETEPITVEEDGSLLVTGRASLDLLEQALETELAEGDAFDTVGGLATSVFGRVPEVGASLEYRGFLLEVVDAERQRVNRLRFRRQTTPTES